jgi:signal transduction histidine kinase
MSRLKLLFSSTAVRLSAVYILLFALCAVFLVVYVTSLSERLVHQQTRQQVTTEASDLQRVFGRGGLNSMLRLIERRARQPGAGLYIIAGTNGEVLAGNVASVEPGVFDQEGFTVRPFGYTRFNEEGESRHHAIAQVIVLDNSMRMLVGRDLAEPAKMRGVVRNALMVALGIMGAGAIFIWYAIGRNALKRIDRMSAATKKIMDGDLSQRLPETGSGDEFDRMSSSLNAMLGRIEKLNEGLRQVSDNIAHDLKTPLTRLRNKAANALELNSDDERREALDGIIMESDQLIRTFNALLMISRVEAGSVAAEMSPVDISAVVTDGCELYEPVAEDAGIIFTSVIEPGLIVNGNRELIGQALTNLIDNAVKYAPRDKAEARLEISLKREDGNVVLSVCDNGPGIPKDKRVDVLKRFVRLDESRSKPGTGLGLSLVEAVMALHGGSLTLGAGDESATDNPGLRVAMVFPQGQ